MGVGALVGFMYGTSIENVSVYGSIDVYENNNILSAGMVAGYAAKGTNTITNVVAVGTINGDSYSSSYMGGIIGVKDYSEGYITIENAIFNGNATGADYLGGIAGVCVSGASTTNFDTRL